MRKIYCTYSFLEIGLESIRIVAGDEVCCEIGRKKHLLEQFNFSNIKS